MEKANKINKSDCPHISKIQITDSNKAKCEVCDIKEHLRLCVSCGSVHCCESGKGHNTEHFKKTGHPIIMSKHTDYDFTWCYKCNAYLQDV